MELAYPLFDRGDTQALSNRRIVHLQEVGDETPLFNLRLRSRHRGLGIGTAAVTWLTEALFGEYDDLHRIEATTRHDWETGVATPVDWEDVR